MTISGIGATPQPENNYDPRKELEERYAQSIFEQLNKNGDDKIDEDDGVNESLLNGLKHTVGGTLNLANFKKHFNKISNFLTNYRYTKDGVYNGNKARISYDWRGQLRSVNTGAQNPTDAARQMGLDRYYYMSEGGNKVALYYHEEMNKQGKCTNRDCFRWDYASQSMVWECGASGTMEPIDDYHASY